MGEAIARLSWVADEVSSATDWQAARRVVSDYLSQWADDVGELGKATHVVAVDSHLARIDAAAGCGRLVRSMRTTLAEVRRAALRVAATSPADTGPDTLGELIGADAPGPVGALAMPPAYAIGEGGVWHLNEHGERKRIAARPVYVAALVRDVVGGAYFADLVWQAPNGEWQVKTYPRQTLSDGRAMVRLASDGVPVDSTTSGALVRYVTAFEAANLGALPVGHCSTVMGWQGEAGALGFLWGESCLGGAVRLMAEGGKAQHAAGYRQAGTHERWVSDVWSRVLAYPRVSLGVYVALAPLVLGVVPSAPGFVCDWSGRSTGGKTTTLRVAASVWGDPGALVKSWSATTAAIEHLGAFSRNLPTILDDTKEAKTNPNKVVGAVYQVTGVASKLRAHPDGLRATASFRTVLMSTGEVPVTSFGQDTGAAARVMPVRGFPFGGVDDDTNRLTADHLNTATLEVFGTLGPMVVDWLVRHRDRWPAIAQRWAEYREAVVAMGEGPFVGRAAPYVATIRVAADLTRAVGLTVCDRALDLATRCALEGANTAQRHRQALRDLWDWLGTRPDLHDRRADDGRPQREVVVRWGQGPPAVVARSLRMWLEREGYQTDVVEEWARLGLIKTTNGRTTHPVEFHAIGRRLRCYVFTAEAEAVATSG